MPASLFEQYPLASAPVATSAGPQPTPYHVYDGHLVLIGGTADLAGVRQLLGPEQVEPVQTQSGRTLMGVYVADEPEASHGPHAELQVSFYVSHQPVAPIPDGPFALLQLLLTEPAARQLCHGLWNDTEAVVAYNREILGLSPRLARYTFERGNGRVRFAFEDVETDVPIASGDVREPARPSRAAITALFRTLGFAGALRAATTKVMEVRVINPISDSLPRNAEAQVLSSSDGVVAHLYDPAQDQVRISDDHYARLDFQPSFVEHMRGLKLVYLPPQ